MEARECLQILKRIIEASFATVDENSNPQVHIIDPALRILL